MAENKGDAVHSKNYRERKIAAGQVFVQMWVKGENADAIRDYAKKLDAGGSDVQSEG